MQIFKTSAPPHTHPFLLFEENLLGTMCDQRGISANVLYKLPSCRSCQAEGVPGEKPDNSELFTVCCSYTMKTKCGLNTSRRNKHVLSFLYFTRTS